MRQSRCFKCLGGLVDVQADAGDGAEGLLNQDAADFFALEEDVVGPLDARL